MYVKSVLTLSSGVIPCKKLIISSWYVNGNYWLGVKVLGTSSIAGELISRPTSGIGDGVSTVNYKLSIADQMVIPRSFLLVPGLMYEYIRHLKSILPSVLSLGYVL